MVKTHDEWIEGQKHPQQKINRKKALEYHIKQHNNGDSSMQFCTSCLWMAAPGYQFCTICGTRTLENVREYVIRKNRVSELMGEI